MLGAIHYMHIVIHIYKHHEGNIIVQIPVHVVGKTTCRVSTLDFTLNING